MSIQGRALREEEVQRIISLLSDTDMTIAEIASRMGCSRSTIISINRRCHVRAYEGSKSKWRIFESKSQGNAEPSEPAA